MDKKMIVETPKLNKLSGFFNIRWLLVVYDLVVYCCVSLLLFFVFDKADGRVWLHLGVGIGSVFVSRMFFNIYRQIWRYGDLGAYFRLSVADGVGFILYLLVAVFADFDKNLVLRILAVDSLYLLMSMTIRMVYHYAYKLSYKHTSVGAFSRLLLRVFTGGKAIPNIGKVDEQRRKIRIAIVGAGRVGVGLAEELLNNPNSDYFPCCFIDINPIKSGRMIYNVPVLFENDVSAEVINKFSIQEVVFALPKVTAEEMQKHYSFYKGMGCRVKVYDYPDMHSTGNSKRHLRDFDIEELLFRNPSEFDTETLSAYYKGKTVMITGGGGSIGSELCRQLAKLSPKKLVILDICENGAYDIQQELRMIYKDKLEIQVEIVSMVDKEGMEQAFKSHRPQVILHAAAHKHVPLMEYNCCEAVKNNVFGTLNTVLLCEKYGAERFIMISTDKAVNPTNVMGATKRMCEMLVLSRANNGSGVKYSATRFGNVLGSSGSVIPLFKRQIMDGGPVTITDKRIIRYFMTIPEASQLVIQSGMLADNGELFVLDMGKPVKILEMAESMIKLAGYEPYKDIDIVEIGLRPGEKLYEELLINSEGLTKTSNNLIYIEKDTPITTAELEEKLCILADALKTQDNRKVKEALMKVVPSFHEPQEVNEAADKRVENGVPVGVS